MFGAVPIFDKDHRLAVTFDVNLEILTAVKTPCIRQNFGQKIQNGLATPIPRLEIHPYHGHDIGSCKVSEKSCTGAGSPV